MLLKHKDLSSDHRTHAITFTHMNKIILKKQASKQEKKRKKKKQGIMAHAFNYSTPHSENSDFKYSLAYIVTFKMDRTT